MSAEETVPRVSVICTVLNEGESIRRLLDSLVLQTCQPDEVVLVDGGSRDNTVEVIREYAARLPLRILVVQLAHRNIVDLDQHVALLRHKRVTVPLAELKGLQ